MYAKFTEEQVIDAVKSEFSVKAVLRKIGLSDNSGSNYKIIYGIVKKNSIDTNHWLGKNSCKGKYSTLRIDASKSFEKKNVNSHRLKLKLIRDGYKLPKCEICGILAWIGKPAPLELDHINGCHQDNCLKNLRILCANCHGQQPTNSGKNRALKSLFTTSV